MEDTADPMVAAEEQFERGRRFIDDWLLRLRDVVPESTRVSPDAADFRPQDFEPIQVVPAHKPDAFRLRMFWNGVYLHMGGCGW